MLKYSLNDDGDPQKNTQRQVVKRNANDTARNGRSSHTNTDSV